MGKSSLPDPFEKARQDHGYGEVNDQDDPVTMVLRLKDLRKCAHNFKTFQSGTTPGRIVVPSEVNIRDLRQVPFEMDPPTHTNYRAAVEAWFKRPLEPDYQAKLDRIVSELVNDVLGMDTVEVVEDFSLRLQSRALTLLLNTPYEEAETWIGWGVHVFRSEETALDRSKADLLHDYIDAQIEKAKAQPGEDFYSVLLASEVNGNKLTKEEVMGVMELTFAGGRDTVINAVTNTVAYFADHPESLDRLRDDPTIIPKAVEELLRYFSPLTHMGRVVTEDTEVCEHAVKADSRISLCWASANRDETVFDHPNEVQLDRQRNPHVAFGFSHHNCLGATHTRQLLSMLLRCLSERVRSIDILDCDENIEDWEAFQRKVGFDRIIVRLHAR